MPWHLIQHNLRIFAHISKWILIAIFETLLSSILVGTECVSTLHVFISMHGKVFSLITIYFTRIYWTQSPSKFRFKFLCPLESARTDSELTFGKLQADAEETRAETERRLRFQNHTLKTIEIFGLANSNRI